MIAFQMSNIFVMLFGTNILKKTGIFGKKKKEVSGCFRISWK